MRVAHFTDLHVFRPPRLSGLLGKRLLGAGNLYLAGRSGRFQDSSAAALVQAVLEQKPDICVCTGDLTAMSQQSEFEVAREILRPLTERLPVVMVPGNHDCYTRGAWRERRFETWFSSFSSGSYPALHLYDDLAFIGLDCCRPHPILATGQLPARQLDELSRLLGSSELDGRFVVLLLHFPLRDARGEPYGPSTRHLVNARDLEAVLQETGRVGLILHGHEHHGFRTELPSPSGAIPIIDPGAGGLALSTARDETACFNVYELTAAGLHGVERHTLGAGGFTVEPGGPYTSVR